MPTAGRNPRRGTAGEGSASAKLAYQRPTTRRTVTVHTLADAGSSRCHFTFRWPIPGSARRRSRKSTTPVKIEAVARRRERKRRKAWLSPTTRRKKAVRPLQTTQRVAAAETTHLWRTIARGAELGQLPALDDVANPPACSPSVATLLQRRVVKVTGEAKLGYQRELLASGGISQKACITMNGGRASHCEPHSALPATTMCQGLKLLSPW